MPIALIVELDAFLATLLCTGIALILALWLFYERRQAILTDNHRLSTLFHCIKCNLIYTRRRRREHAPCPRCGFNNIRLRF
ncbi:MAG: hypothetical protein LBD14_04775 [Puniceicoccales bacterium]|nr:hypothetical protein [Puniceicoccales bacterium]